MASSLIRRGFRLCIFSSSLTSSRGSVRCASIASSFRFLTGHACSYSDPSWPAAVRPFSSKVGAEEKLSMVLTSEIENASPQAGDEVSVPSGFPFQIVDSPGEESITLKRKYGGENIEVLVLYNVDADENIDEDDDDDHSDNEDNSMEASISLQVTIDKGQDSLLEFCCMMNPSEMQIHSMTLKARDAIDDQGLYGGPPFSDLDEKLQNEFYEYLGKRGIDSSMFEFLQEYMVKKDDREYLTWLTNMKSFISE